MTTERTLRKWRAEALKKIEDLDGWDNQLSRHVQPTREVIETSQRILRLTQELLDQHLLRKEIKK